MDYELDANAAASNLEQRQSRSALPPTDTGYQAWLCLAGCFMTNVLIWGFSFSFGVLQQHYSSHEPFASNPSGIPAIGTTATGLMYLLMPLYFLIYQRWPRTRTWALYISLPMVTAALVGASFANTVTHLILCQGVLFALAGNALVTPTITYLDEWFVRRKGLAIGIMWAGDGTGGVIMPYLLQALLARYGFRWTLRAVAALIIILTLPMLWFLKPRIPISTSYRSRPLNMAFVKAPLFWTLQVFNIAQALGYFLPTNYLPSIAEPLTQNASLGSLTLLLVNLGGIFGCVGMGGLVDRFEITTILALLSLCAGTVIFLALGFSTSFGALCVFSLLYGFTASSYSTSWGGMIKDIQNHHEGADANIIFSFLAAGRGLGSVISGPLSEGLLAHNKDLIQGAKTAYSSQYGPIIIFSGCTALAGGGSWLIRKARLIQQ